MLSSLHKETGENMSKEIFIENLTVGEELTDFFMAKNGSLKTGSNQKIYFDVTLADKTGEINGKKWDVSDDEAASLSVLKDGTVVKIRASVSEWNGIKQLKILRIRKAADSDELEMSDFVKAAPEDPEEMLSYITGQAEAIGNPRLKALCLNTLSENREKLLYYPAAKANHHAELGGLLYHTRRMLTLGLKACLVYTNLDKDWVTAGVIMHDMEKINEIAANEFGISSGYTVKGNLLGHIVMGAISMAERAKAAGLSEEETVMMQHMIISHHNEPEFGSPLRPMFPEAELLHHLDMLDARMYDFEEGLKSAQPGGFSERVRTLDGRLLYKPSFADEKK